MTTTKRQGRIHHDPSKVKKIYPLDAIHLGLETLLVLDQRRLLTNQQVAEMVFRDTLTAEGNLRSSKMVQKAANEVLRKLVDNGCVTRVEVELKHRLTGRYFQTHLNLLTREGAQIVQQRYNDAESGQKTRWRSDLKSNYRYSRPNHLVRVNDAIIHLSRSLWAMGAEDILVFDQDQYDGAFKGLIPDAIIIVFMPSGRICVFFIEVDRGTMTNISGLTSVKDWKKKIENYGAYFRVLYRQHQIFFNLGIDPADVAHPLVLSITEADGRLKHLRAATHAAGGGNSYWHTTFSEFWDTWLAATNAIWYRPVAEEPVSLADHLRD